MNDEIRIRVDRVKEFIGQHKSDLLAYKKNDHGSLPNLWKMLRADLMRLAPGKVGAYLKRDDLKLHDAGSFGPALADEFFSPETSGDDLAKNQEALLMACLELEAAWKLSGSQAAEDRKKVFRQKLALWDLGLER